MKKLLLSFLFVFAVMGAKAQFEYGTKYVGASLTGLNLSYSENEEFRLGLNATAGFFVSDGIMLKGNIGYDHTHHLDDFNLGVGARYFFLENGIFLGAGAEYNHFTKNNNDLMIPIEVGYVYYLNHFFSIEPSAYYKMSLHDFGGNSTVGLSVGIGYYF